MYDLPLDSKTVLLKASAKDIINRTLGSQRRKGIDFKLYQHGGDNAEDVQTVMTFLSSMQNPSPDECKDKKDVELLIQQELDRIILSDRVRSCCDFYKVNNKKDNIQKMTALGGLDG